MKISQMWLLVGLVMGVMVVWAGVAPIHASSALLGGFYPTGPGACCVGAHTGYCTDAASGPGQPPGSLGCNSWSDLIWCDMSGAGAGTCELMADIPCAQTGDPVACNTTHSMTCN